MNEKRVGHLINNYIPKRQYYILLILTLIVLVLFSKYSPLPERIVNVVLTKRKSEP